jgi:hypothetical protein
VKYLLMIYNSATEQPTPAELEELVRGHAALHRELAEQGVVIGSASLTDPASATTVRVRGGVPAITDGPYAETKEYLAGYYLVDCSLERAVEIAGRIPCGVAGGGVEIRALDLPVTAAVTSAVS